MFVARVRPVYLEGPSTTKSSTLGRDLLPGALLVGAAVAVFLWLFGGRARRARRRRRQSRVYLQQPIDAKALSRDRRERAA
jgi:hypothetical protein